MNHDMIPNNMHDASSADTDVRVSSGRRLARIRSSTTSAVRAEMTPRTTLSQILIFWATQQASSPPRVEKYVAMSRGRNTSAGLAAPSCAR